MKVVTAAIGALALAVGCARLPPKASAVVDATALSGVRSAFLGSFGSGESASEARERMRVELLKSTRFAVAESETAADAVLSGAVGLSQTMRDGSTHYRPFGVLRLVLRQNDRVVWLHEFSDRRRIAPPIESDPAPLLKMMVAQFSERLLSAAGDSATPR